MIAAERLAMLCPGTVRYENRAGGSGKPVLVGVEMAGLLKGLPPIAVALAEAKYLQVMGAERRLYLHVLKERVETARREGWYGQAVFDVVESMCVIAVNEVVKPPRCKSCNGVGFAKARLCSTCHGSGFRYSSGRSLAQALQMPHESFRVLWRRRYDNVFNYVSDIDTQINRAVARNNWDAMVG